MVMLVASLLLVVFPYPSEKSWTSSVESVGIMTFPTEWKVIIQSCSSHHQPVVSCFLVASSDQGHRDPGKRGKRPMVHFSGWCFVGKIMEDLDVAVSIWLRVKILLPGSEAWQYFAGDEIARLSDGYEYMTSSFSVANPTKNTSSLVATWSNCKCGISLAY